MYTRHLWVFQMTLNSYNIIFIGIMTYFIVHYNFYLVRRVNNNTIMPIYSVTVKGVSSSLELNQTCFGHNYINLALIQFMLESTCV